MTLQTFLEATADVPDAVLRPAMVAALAIEPARTPEGFRRFYDRVARALNLDMIAETGRGDADRGEKGLRAYYSTTR